MSQEVGTRCAEYFRQLYTECGSVLESALTEDNIRNISASHSYVGDFAKWIEILRPRKEVQLLTTALLEYQYAILALSSGIYRHSYFGLRLFIELALNGIYYSAYEIELRSWISAERDNKWTAIIDKDNGVFSSRYTKLFFGNNIEDAAWYRSNAERLYRECSEYVHCNINTINCLPSNISFNQAAFEDWHEKAKSAYRIVSFALCTRYLTELTADQLNSIEHVVLDVLGFIPEFRNCFGGVTEAAS